MWEKLTFPLFMLYKAWSCGHFVRILREELGLVLELFASLSSLSLSLSLSSLSLFLSLALLLLFFPHSPPHVLETEILDQRERKGGNGRKRNQTVTGEHVQETKKRQDNRNTFFLSPAALALAPSLVSLS